MPAAIDSDGSSMHNEASSSSWHPSYIVADWTSRRILASGVYISGFDKSLFAEISAEYGVPFVVSVLLAAWFLSQAHWNFGLLPGAISSRSWALYASGWALERYLLIIVLWQWCSMTFPFVFLCLWGVMVGRQIAAVLGVAIIILGVAAMLVAFGICRWHHNGWRVDNAVRWSFGIGGSLVLIYELYIVFANAANSSYSYLGFSFVFITLNMLPLIAVNYLLAQAVAKPISLYALLDGTTLLRTQAQLPNTNSSDDTKHNGGNGGNGTGAVAVQVGKADEHAPLLHDNDIPYQPLNSASTRRLRIGLTVLSILILFAFGTVVQIYSSDDGSVGWITMAAILVCDATIYMCVFGAKIDSPSQTCCFQIMARVILILPGDNYWFIGHCFMYLLLACFFATCIVDTHSPQLSDRQRVSAAVTDKIAETEMQRPRDRTAMALDEARRRYWLKMGKFFESKFGQWLQYWVDVCALVILTLFFTASLLLNVFISETSLVFWGVSHSQYIVGIVTLFVVAVFALSHAIYRHYRNNEFKITLWIAAWTFLLYACVVGAAIGLYNLTSSVTLLCLCCYMPSIIILSAESYRWWKNNDYNLLAPIVTAEDVARHKRQQSEGVPPMTARATSSAATTESKTPTSDTAAAVEAAVAGLERKKSVEMKDDSVVIPPLMIQMMDIVRKTNKSWLRTKVVHERTCTDYLLSAMLLLDIILVAAMGTTISYYSTPTYIGYSISAILLIVAGTAIPIIKWYNSYRMTGGFIPCIILTMITLGAWLATLWYVDLVSYVDDGTYTKTNAVLALVGLALTYPVVVLFVTCFYQYRDSGWKIRGNACVPIAFIIASSLVIGYFISVTVLYSMIWGAGALAFFIVFMLLVVILPGVTNRWALRIIYTVLVMAGIAFALFIAIYPDTGYLGFSILVGVIFLAILGRTLLIYRDQLTLWFASVHDNPAMTQFQAPGDILPVFIYNASDINSPVQAHGGRVWLVYALLAIAFIWGVLEVFFVAGSSFAIGVGVSCICILIATWFTFEGTTSSLIAFHKAVTYLEEGSDRYVDTIQQVKRTIEPGFFNRMAAQGLIDEHELRASRGNGKVVRSVDGVAEAHDRKAVANDFKGSYWSTLNWAEAWRHVWQAYNSMPASPLCYCTRDEPALDFHDIIALLPTPRPARITRQVAWSHIMRFNRDLSTVYKLRAEFVAGIMFEVFHTVHHMRMEDEHEMISMLQSIGYVDVTAEMFARLPSSIRDQLGDLYQAFKRNRQQERDVSAKRRSEAHLQEDDRDRALTKLLPTYDKYGKSSLERQGSAYKPTPHDGLDFIDYLKRANVVQWIDPDLPGAKLLWKKAKLPGEKSKWDKYKEFARPEVFLPSKTPVIFHSMDNLPDRIKQGAIGDCYVMSALSVLAEHRRDQLKRMILTKAHGPWGAYAVQFYIQGKPQIVVVDSAFPIDEKKRQAFARSTIPEELWVSIIEKAYAKLYSSYEAIESGFVDQALIDMTGGIGSRIDMTKPDVKQKIRNGQLWTTILSYRNNGYLMGAGTPAGSDDVKNASAMGIVQGHAYAILDIVEIDEHKLIQLRNPWGKFEWKGDWSDKSDKWTTRLKTKLNVQDIDDGKFWMSFLDFSRHFEDIYVCRFFDTPNWHATEINDEWKGITAGGCTNEPECINSPQYALTVTEPTQFIISLSQEDRRAITAGGKYPAIAIEVYQNDGKRVSDIKCGTLVATNPESYIFRREVLVECFLEPSRHPYTVLISTYDKGQEAKFLVRVHGQNARRSYTFGALPKEKL